MELLPGALCGEDSVANMTHGQGGNQADAHEELPDLLVGTEAVRPDDASDVPWQRVKRWRRLAGRALACLDKLMSEINWIKRSI